MSDVAKGNGSPVTKPKPQKKRTVRPVRVALFAGTVLMLAGLLLLSRGTPDLDRIRRSITYRNTPPEAISLPTGDTMPVGESFLHWAPEEITLYSSGGEPIWTVPVSMNCPKILTADQRVLVYDAGGSGLLEFSGDAVPELHLSPGALLDADISQNRLCYVWADGAGMTTLTALSTETDEVFTCPCPAGYFTACAISPDGRTLAAACCRGGNGQTESSVLLCSVDGKAPLAQTSTEAAILTDLLFLDDETLCAAGGEQLLTMDSRGARIGSWGLEGQQLLALAVEEDGIVLYLKQRDENRLLRLKEDCTLVQSIACGSLTAMDLRDGYLAAADENGVSVYCRDLSLYRQEPAKWISALQMRPDGTVMVLGGGTAQLYFYD